MRVVWGGTFDPVHNGHIRLANQLVSELNLDDLHLMPCFKAVHKENVSASPFQRVEMLKLATKAYPKLIVDEREIKKRCDSYTYDSLSDIRREIGKESLSFVIGTDSLMTFPSWYRACDIHQLANIVVIHRPSKSFASTENKIVFNKNLSGLGFSLIDVQNDLKNYQSGKILSLNLEEINISSTDIRCRIKNNEVITPFVNSDVDRYIQMHHLYSK